MNRKTSFDFFVNTVKKCIYKRNHILKDKAAEYGLNIAEAEVLLYLAEKDMGIASDIVKECCISKAFVSKLIIGLLAKKLITITKDEKDKRCQHITLTEKAKKIAAEINCICFQFMGELTDGITEDEERTLKGIFRKIEENLERG